MQHEITQPGPLLDPSGRLSQTGWSRHPLLDCNLENAKFYRLKMMQFLRVKRWDYYAIFTPTRFFSATIADLGYAGNIFVYTLDYENCDLYEEGLVIPLGRGMQLPRNSAEGETHFSGKGVELSFAALASQRRLTVSWPAFHNGQGIQAEIDLYVPDEHESMNIVIPIAGNRFYYNHKINCMPAKGRLIYGDIYEELDTENSLGSLDWGRGVWPYRSFWNWASASGFLPDRRKFGLNLGTGFGDTSAATENCFILDGKLHKLEQVTFNYNPSAFTQPWNFQDSEGRLRLTFIPFKERVARTNLGLIFSEGHQVFGRYQGQVITEAGEVIQIRDLTGFAEEHRARW